MNFLSHFYFDRHNTDSYHVTGTVLPDLLKNADKTANIHPEKIERHEHPYVNSLLDGWKRHLEVDRHFHSSDFFIHHSHQLKDTLKPATEGSPVKPFFLGHIALELILDNLLITTQKINVDAFYAHLENTKQEHLHSFWAVSKLHNPDVFFKFWADFKRHRYLNTYAEAAQVAYALKRICMRVWKDPFTPEQEAMLTEAVLDYRAMLLPYFMGIFDEIESYLL
ncbi:hypothetical protein BEL04_14910 [Mucilaginibacter sp. PPCGB 2223]|uniref:hypothetical protein n=1 Tax=Mucilaginibacter sp. PPCGB 2223 TaxID=1886027 RepID=UPI000825DF10|nr:hypothetical protein [Mucilaginibacter sp. PPCGB 2223]OCX51320.1 hypothetical protein BEL04_14910 [Mucilaginibacter sp. PPCGB 2223]